MTKFNKVRIKRETVNLAGGRAYPIDPRVEFILLMLTSFLEDQYYASREENQNRLLNLIENINDKTFLAKGALYARDKFGMRSVSHMVAAELSRAECNFSKPEFLSKIVIRPDDMLEIATYYLERYGKPLPNSMKRGFAKAFEKFDDYDIAKYKKENLGLKLVDLVNLVHPKPTGKNRKALEALVKGGKIIAETWEVMLTQAGQESDEENREQAKSEAWKKYLDSGKVSYFALLRNLRNILKTVSEKEYIDKAISILTDEKRIKSSRLFPYRFLAAYREISRCEEPNTRCILPAISQALDISVNNMELPPGETAVLVDLSSSMHQALSKYSHISLDDVASVMGAILWKAGADLILFSHRGAVFTGNPQLPILEIAEKITRHPVSCGGTSFSEGLKLIKKHYDRVIVLSDMQSWMETYFANDPVQRHWKKLQESYGPMKFYSWDLAGYGTLQIPENNVYLLGGFSEKVFDLMKYLERGPDPLIAEINSYEF